MSFKISGYEKIIKCLVELRDKPVWTVGEAARHLKNGVLAKPCVILRHDVDRRAHRAVRLAELEAKYGIKSTYYFRSCSNGSWPQKHIKEISDLGHETGYHYETLSRCKGHRSSAIEMFKKIF